MYKSTASTLCTDKYLANPNQLLGLLVIVFGCLFVQCRFRLCTWETHLRYFIHRSHNVMYHKIAYSMRGVHNTFTLQ